MDALLRSNLQTSCICKYILFMITSWFQAGCTAVAALLHYLFLVVFFTMLAEGVLLIRMVVWPLVASIRIAWKLMIGIWGRYNPYDDVNIGILF